MRKIRDDTETTWTHFSAALKEWEKRKGAEVYIALLKKLFKHTDKLKTPGFAFGRIERQLTARAAALGITVTEFINKMFSGETPDDVMKFLNE